MLQPFCLSEMLSASVRPFFDSLASPNGETSTAQAGNQSAAPAVSTGSRTPPKQDGELKAEGFSRKVTNKEK